MSTKVTLKSFARTDRLPGFHIYDDVLDYFGDTDLRSDAPIYLTVEGVEISLETLPTGGVAVTLKVPRSTAIELGLVRRHRDRWKGA